MQYNYTESFTNFEDEVLHRLKNIEKRMNDIAGNSSLANEMIRAQLPSNVQSNRKPFFNIVLLKNENEEPIFRISGRTFDVKDQLKTFGSCIFHKESKAWEFIYEEETYNRVIEYLRTLTDEVNIIS